MNTPPPPAVQPITYVLLLALVTEQEVVRVRNSYGIRLC